MKAFEVLFWISLFIVFYTYIGYGILLYILGKIKECFRKPAPRPMPADDALPPLTLFIAAYNEEDVVDEKMRNCLELDYPADKLRILWVTDGSNDHTNERLSHWPQAIVLHQPQRQGKTAALNRGIHFVETPLVVFTDANTHLNREALREIVHAFTDPKVGCVAGEKRIAVQSKDNAASGGEGLYWKYESTLKALDARLYSAVGAAGELFAVRRELFEEMQTDTLLDDFILSLRIVMQGHTIAYCANAYAVESGSADMREEEKRKVRIAAGGLQSIWRLRHCSTHSVTAHSVSNIFPTGCCAGRSLLSYCSYCFPSTQFSSLRQARHYCMPSSGCYKLFSTSWEVGGTTFQ